MKNQSSSENEKIIRSLYQAAEVKDFKLFSSFFADDGYFWDVSAGKKHFGDEIGQATTLIAEAFPDMHRELYDVWAKDDENVVIVELSLNATHNGPLHLPEGIIPPTGKKITVPCADIFVLDKGKVKSFHCYMAATILFGQIEVYGHLEEAIEK